MADGHGGARTPSNPAPVSGPGRLSKRTDGGPGQKLMAPSGMDYGDHKTLMDQERTAAMSQADTPPSVNVPSAPSGAGPSGPALPPFGAPSARPNEPITHGVDIGPGGGSDVLPQQLQPGFQNQGAMTQMLAQLGSGDLTGPLADLYQAAHARGV